MKNKDRFGFGLERCFYELNPTAADREILHPADVTNAEQNFHTDNSYNICPPDHVTLLCLHPAQDGGISRVVSLNTAHNRLRETHPELLDRLYEPFYFDRQREHGPEDEK
ncbi:MAG: TauD/TfdA family dioxygenase, partial [Sneathiella sp.]